MKRDKESLLKAKIKKNGVSDVVIKDFRHIIYDYYRRHVRSFPWRQTSDPYSILVSEIMLQQTQTDRVVEKFNEFISRFGDFRSLARASVRDVLAVWQGLGYNRRALALKKAAEAVMKGYDGALPESVDELKKLPGIGKATAGAIAAYAFNKSVVFIETNIRTVFIHFFFDDKEKVTDAEILPLVAKTLDVSNPRRWYNALMDYGVMLKKKHKNPSRRSIHHTRQTPFKGSNRQIRGRIIKAFVTGKNFTAAELARKIGVDREKIEKNLVQLQREGFLNKSGRRFVVQ